MLANGDVIGNRLAITQDRGRAKLSPLSALVDGYLEGLLGGGGCPYDRVPAGAMPGL